MKYNFPCGCNFDKFDPYNPPDCPEAWKLIGEGKTKGMFQIESYLCKHWAKKLKPDNIELLSALIALVRPGVLKAKDETGKSMAELFVERKDGAECEPLDKNVENVLKDTFQIILYQEEVLAIAKVLAGFNLVQADLLRKGIGHKQADLVAKCRQEFIEGCAKTGLVNSDKANYIFDIIEKSNRYLFNKCLSKNSTVETRYGIINITDVNIGDEILCPGGFKKVVNIYNNGYKHIAGMTLTNNMYIECTLDHKFQSDEILPLSQIVQKNKSVLTKNGFQNWANVKYLNKQDTIDLEIDSEDHIFYANGIAVSNSHSISYGFTSYITAYLKSHFPLEFFTSWIKYAREDQDFQQEIRELINDARIFGISVKPPRLLDFNKNAYNRNKTIYFGLADIKGVGEKAVDKIVATVKELNSPSLIDLIINSPHKLMENLIKSGALDEFGPRTKSLHILGIYSQLSIGEKSQFKQLYKSGDINCLEEFNSKLKKEGGLCSSVKRQLFVESLIKTIKKPPRNLKDTPTMIAEYEKEMLGVNLTASKVDTSVLAHKADSECIEFLRDQIDRGVFALEIIDMDIRKVKTGSNKGKEMCVLSGGDATGVIENIVCFANEYEGLTNILIRGNTILVRGERSKDRRQLIIREAWQA